MKCDTSFLKINFCEISPPKDMFNTNWHVEKTFYGNVEMNAVQFLHYLTDSSFTQLVLSNSKNVARTKFGRGIFFSNM